MENRFSISSYCIFTVAIFFGLYSSQCYAQRFLPTDSTFQIGGLSSSFGPLVSPKLNAYWEAEGSLSLYAVLPLTKYSSVRIGFFELALLANQEYRQSDFASITTYGSIIPFQVEWVPKIVISPEIGLGFTKVEPSDNLEGVAAGSETELLSVVGLQVYSTAFGRFQPTINAQYFRVYTYFEYDFTQINIGLRYSFTPPKRIRRWWRPDY